MPCIPYTYILPTPISAQDCSSMSLPYGFQFTTIISLQLMTCLLDASPHGTAGIYLPDTSECMHPQVPHENKRFHDADLVTK